MHQVPNNPVGVDGFFIGGQERHPLLQPLLLHPFDFVSYPRIPSSSFWTYLLLYLFHELPKNQLGIADDGVVQLLLLV